MKFLLLLLICFAGISCKTNTNYYPSKYHIRKSKTHNNDSNFHYIEPVMIDEGDSNKLYGTQMKRNRIDTIIWDEGRYLTYNFLSKDAYIIKWGIVDSFENSTADTIRVLPSGPFYLKKYDREAAYLTQDCGTGCSYAYIFVFRENSICKKYYDEPALHDIDKNIIVYSRTISRDNYSFVVENYLTGDSIGIMKGISCQGPDANYCLQNISLQGNKLKISYAAEHASKPKITLIDISKLTT